MLKDYFRFAFKNIVEKGIRSWLTMIGIIIGIAAVVSLISIGEGMQTGINEQFEMMGADVIMIMPGENIMSIASGSSLGENDIELIKKINGISIVGSALTRVAKVKFKDEVKYTWVSGMPTDDAQDIFLDMQQMEIEKGQERFKKTDMHKTFAGYLLSHGEFFENEVKLRDRILINDQEFKVVSLMGKIGNPQDDSSLLIPLDAARDLFNAPDEVSMIIARVKPGVDIDKVADEIKERMRKDRGLEKGEEDFNVQTSEQLMESISTILNLVQAFIIGIAAISLIVGGIGITNTMYTSVLERTREIGVMKAIGARNEDVLVLFLIESGILGIVGGLIGIIAGLGMGKLAEFAAVSAGVELLKVTVNPVLITGALAFSFLVGMISGIMPARQASKLQPVEALRYE